MNKPVVKELIQDEMNVENIVAELKKLTTDDATRSRIYKDYADLRELLSQGGNASGKAAEIIVKFLRGKDQVWGVKLEAWNFKREAWGMNVFNV